MKKINPPNDDAVIIAFEKTGIRVILPEALGSKEVMPGYATAGMTLGSRLKYDVEWRNKIISDSQKWFSEKLDILSSMKQENTKTKSKKGRRNNKC